MMCIFARMAERLNKRPPRGALGSTSARDNDCLWPIVLYAFDLLLLLGGDFCTQSFLLRSELGSELSTEILRLKHRADFHLRPAIKGRALQPFHRLVDRPNLPKPEAGNQLLCLGKWAVNDGARGSRKSDALPFFTWMQALACQHNAGLHQLFVVFAHITQNFLARHCACL